MESEIFGHVRGAFTGAAENRAGAAELADGGTLFLDEIAEMDLGLQAKLLRFVQTGTLRRVGGSETRRVDVRIVSATNRDPVRRGRRRAAPRRPLLPAARAADPPAAAPRAARGHPAAGGSLPGAVRGGGRPALHRLRRGGGRLTRGASDWPGNVRQLANVIRRVVVLDDGERVTAAMLPESIRGHGAPSAAPGEPRRGDGSRPVGAGTGDHRERARRHGGNIARAAAALEISPSTIYRKLQNWSGPAAAGA